MIELQQTELQSLQNAADNLGMIVHEKFTQDKRQKRKKYFATINGVSVSPVLEYEHLNYFLLGFSKCHKLISIIA